MNKYYGTQESLGGDVRWMLMPDESILWQGTPKKKAFVVNSSTKMMPIALLWLFFDGGMILSIAGAFSMGESGIPKEMLLFLVPFFAIHLMPVWMWIGSFLKAFGRWKNTSYVVTTHRILIRNGLADSVYESIDLTDIGHVSLRIQSVDKMMGVGDVLLALDSSRIRDAAECAILDIEDYQYVYNIVQRSVADAQMRMQRVQENRGTQEPQIVNVL